MNNNNNKGRKFSRAEINSRFSRVAGHLNATMRMAENGRDLDDVIIQLAAVEALVRNLKKDIIKYYFNTTLYEEEVEHNLKIKKLEKYINHILK